MIEVVDAEEFRGEMFILPKPDFNISHFLLKRDSAGSIFMVLDMDTKAI